MFKRRTGVRPLSDKQRQRDCREKYHMDYGRIDERWSQTTSRNYLPTTFGVEHPVTCGLQKELVNELQKTGRL